MLTTETMQTIIEQETLNAKPSEPDTPEAAAFRRTIAAEVSEAKKLNQIIEIPQD